MNDLFFTSFDKIPGEAFLVKCLQRDVLFLLSGKSIRKGRLLLFKRFNFFIQLCLLNEKKQKETFDVPIPFNVEHYEDENLLFFDYRISSLNCSKVPTASTKLSSNYLNKILEISVLS